MLEPGARVLLLDAFRPPAGYQFDRAIGTTFSLDLHALLVAPLALAAFDWETPDGRLPDDPVALLESLRRCADRIDLFYQAGEIALPAGYHRLYTWLEELRARLSQALGHAEPFEAPDRWADRPAEIIRPPLPGHGEGLGIHWVSHMRHDEPGNEIRAFCSRPPARLRSELHQYAAAALPPVPRM